MIIHIYHMGITEILLVVGIIIAIILIYKFVKFLFKISLIAGIVIIGLTLVSSYGYNIEQSGIVLEKYNDTSLSRQGLEMIDIDVCSFKVKSDEKEYVVKMPSDYCYNNNIIVNDSVTVNIRKGIITEEIVSISK